MRSHASQSGRALVPLVLLLLLIAGGGYNYWRNLQLEAAEDRPYRGYSDGDLEALRGAYDQEREVANRRFTARKGSAGVREGGFIDEQIDEFDRVHRLGREKRRLAGEVAANDSVLDELDRELGIRARDTSPWAAHLRRLTSF